MPIRRFSFTLPLLVLAAMLLWAAGGAAIQSLAQGPGPVASPQTTMDPWLQYQGRLTYVSGSDPISGSVWMTFRLFDTPVAGAPMWTEVKQVQVISGLFSTRLGDTAGLDPYFFTGAARWLEVAVENQDTSPRQEILPVAYALSLRPGAYISGTSVEPILTLNNRGAGDALRVDGNLNVSGDLIGGSHAHSGSAINSGTVVEARIDPAIARDSEVAAALGAVPQIRNQVAAGYAAAYTVTIPHYQLFRLEMASDWPGTGGLAVLEGFENDGRTAVTFTKYDGSSGTSGSGGAQCLCGSANALLVFGSGSNTYGVRCAPCGAGIPYSLVITRSGNLAVNFKVTY